MVTAILSGRPKGGAAGNNRHEAHDDKQTQPRIPDSLETGHEGNGHHETVAADGETVEDKVKQGVPPRREWPAAPPVEKPNSEAAASVTYDPAGKHRPVKRDGCPGIHPVTFRYPRKQKNQWVGHKRERKDGPAAPVEDFCFLEKCHSMEIRDEEVSSALRGNQPARAD